MVELARQLRRQRSARQEVGRGIGRRRGRLSGTQWLVGGGLASLETALDCGRESMSEADAGRRGAIRREIGNAPAIGAADWLHLAAAPTFAIMALLTGVLGGGSPEALCSSASPLSG